ncbi:MAG: metal ABC transporter substrate-binding protein [Candidatus Brocadiales bacterium]
MTLVPLIFGLVVFLPVTVFAKLNVVATTPNLGAIAREIGGDKVKVKTLARPLEDPHFVDAKPSFIILLNRADVLVEGGAYLEAGWLAPLIEGARNKKILIGSTGRIVGSEGVALIQAPTTLDRALGDIHPRGNPHYLLDPLNGKIVAQHICDTLCKLDASSCSYFQANLERFTRQVDEKMGEWDKLMMPFKGAKIVTYHKSYDYLLERFGLELVDTLEPKPGIPPSPTHINDLVPLMKEQGVKVIIIEPNKEKKTPDFIAKKTGAKVLVLPGTVGSNRKVKDYISLFDYNLTQLASAIKGEH